MEAASSLLMQDQMAKRRGTVRERVVDLIQDELDNPALSPPFISKRLGISERSIQREFLNVGVAKVIRKMRVDRAADILRSSTDPVPLTKLARMAGFNSSATFRRVFTDEFGVPPSEFHVSSQGKIGGKFIDEGESEEGGWPGGGDVAKEMHRRGA